MEVNKKNILEMNNLEKVYIQSKTDYYRFFIRNEIFSVWGNDCCFCIGELPENFIHKHSRTAGCDIRCVF